MPQISIIRVRRPGEIFFMTAGPDKAVICGGNPIPFNVIAVLPTPTNQWTISGNHAADFVTGDFISIAYNTGTPPASEHAVVSAVDSGPNTIVTVNALTPIAIGMTGTGLMWIQDVVLEATVIGDLYGHTLLWEHLGDGEQLVDYGGSIAGASAPTGLPNTAAIFSAVITIDGTPIPINIQGQNAQTFGDLIFQLNSQLGAPATAAFQVWNIVVRSNSGGPLSTVNILDLNLFASTNGFIQLNQQIGGSDPVTFKGSQAQLTTRYTASVVQDRWFRFWIDKGTNYEMYDDIFVTQTPTSYMRNSFGPKKRPGAVFQGASLEVTTFDSSDSYMLTGDWDDCRIPLVHMVPVASFPFSGSGGFAEGPPYLFIYNTPHCRPEDVEYYEVQESTGSGWTVVNTTLGPSYYPAITGRNYRVAVKFYSQYENNMNGNVWVQTSTPEQDTVFSRELYASPDSKVLGAVSLSSRMLGLANETEFQSVVEAYDVLVRTLVIVDWNTYPELDDEQLNHNVNQHEQGTIIENYDVIVRTLTIVDWNTYPELDDEMLNHNVNQHEQGTIIESYSVAGGAQIGG